MGPPAPCSRVAPTVTVTAHGAPTQPPLVVDEVAHITYSRAVPSFVRGRRFTHRSHDKAHGGAQDRCASARRLSGRSDQSDRNTVAFAAIPP